MKTFPTRPPPRNRLLIFARVPEYGRVKSRLARDLGEQRTLALYEAMLGDLLASIGGSAGDLEVEVLWTGSSEVSGALLEHHFGGRPLARQAGETLGDRLAVSFGERIFFHRTEKVIAIGTDDPSLTREAVERAFLLLDGCDWVIGPAEDGGYYLIGCRAASYDASVFRDIEWGTSEVFETTTARIRDIGSSMALLPHRRDIDIVDDLRSYSAEVNPESRIAEVLREWGWV